ncbi:RNA-metabolising metallo-beta-lactamase [Thiomicrospira aerophila AL3]|uniref:RNA-metabolising metallo-beta-lactamase n=1 Tax=Thiomicrospira aerophila AL3 TaxID=717772 RepID=W0DW83_9GAMM|nr:ribonuclease J [Thiomicrospira aerophila]AHF01239.1 RNA-metabolising metallo-beta-lactamase [Thiomicrospira aerophila AL3]
MNNSTPLLQLPIPNSRDFWCLPLGGVGEIGQNMMLYAHDGQYLMVDCGLGFEPIPGSTMQFQRVIANPAPLMPFVSKLSAIVITHGHEDHIGALVHLWPKLRKPIYASPFAMALIRRKFAEAELLDKVELITVLPHQLYQIGSFQVNWIQVTHSIPQSHSLLISTSLGYVLHTGDWKIDTQPLVDKPFNLSAFKDLAGEHLLAVVADSTNAIKPGHTPSESACYPDLLKLVQNQPGRVVVSCFSSNIARLITLARVAKASGRYLALAGRALENMVATARQLGYWPSDYQPIALKDLGYLPKDEVLLVTTGSQGEPNAGLWRLAKQQHRFLELDPGDTVIFSAIRIPDNLTRIRQLERALIRLQLTVIHAEDHPELHLHVSGHPRQGDIIKLYEALQPPLLIPVHGEPAHLAAHTDLATNMGIKVLSGENGDLFRFKPFVSLEKHKVNTGVLIMDDD